MLLFDLPSERAVVRFPRCGIAPWVPRRRDRAHHQENLGTEQQPSQHRTNRKRDREPAQEAKSPVSRGQLRVLGLRMRRGAFILRNLPPATVYVYTRDKGTRDKGRKAPTPH